ncbi:MAG: hypothetical protein ACI4XA_01050 [Oscillospiraceae bacterium]
MKTIEYFFSEIITNTELAEAAKKAMTENRLAEFLTEHGVDGTAEAFEALVNEKLRSGHELSDEDIEQAAGGAADWRQEHYIKNNNVPGMIMYLSYLARSGIDLYDPNTNTTFTVKCISNKIPGRFELIDVAGKAKTRSYTAYSLYCEIIRHEYLLPWDR